MTLPSGETINEKICKEYSFIIGGEGMGAYVSLAYFVSEAPALLLICVSYIARFMFYWVIKYVGFTSKSFKMLFLTWTIVLVYMLNYQIMYSAAAEYATSEEIED